MNKIQQIEEVVRERCPWLMELSFGCEVQIWNHDEDKEVEDYNIFGNRKVTKESFYYQSSQAVELQGWGIEQIGNLKIIGHPVQLSDVLYVIDKIPGVGVNLVGHSSLLCIYSNTHEHSIKYNLTLPLKDQSEETINFIHSIICK